MIENLELLVRDSAQDTIVNNSAIPNEQNELAIKATSTSIFDALKAQMASGNISSIANIFKQGNASTASLVMQ